MGENLQKTLKTWYNNNPLVKLGVGVVSGAIIIETTLFLLKVVIALGMYLTSFLPPQPAGPELIQFALSSEDIIRLVDNILFACMFSIYCIYQLLLFLIEISRRLRKTWQADATDS